MGPTYPLCPQRGAGQVGGDSGSPLWKEARPGEPTRGPSCLQVRREEGEGESRGQVGGKSHSSWRYRSHNTPDALSKRQGPCQTGNPLSRFLFPGPLATTQWGRSGQVWCLGPQLHRATTMMWARLRAGDLLTAASHHRVAPCGGTAPVAVDWPLWVLLKGRERKL